MAINTTFIDYLTPVSADWLNNANATVNAIRAIEYFGAKGDGITDDTVAIQAALNSAANIEFKGTYVCGPVTVGNQVKTLTSRSGAKFIPNGTVPATGTWWVANSLIGANISGLTWSTTPYATYSPGLIVLQMNACTDTHIERCTISPGGYIPIQLNNCAFSSVSKCKIYTFGLTGIQGAGSSSYGNVVSFNDVNGLINGGTSIAHGCSFQLGQWNKIIGNHFQQCGTFGASMYQVNGGIISENTCFNTVHEGINIEDSNQVLISNNQISWPASSSLSIDFGISVFGNAAITQFNAVKGNNVANSAASGICFTGNVSFNTMEGNTVVNGNMGALSDPGILFSGSNCLLNSCNNNMVIDTTGLHHTYGIGEIDKGNGLPSNNSVSNNFIQKWITAGLSLSATTLAQSFNNILTTV